MSLVDEPEETTSQQELEKNLSDFDDYEDLYSTDDDELVSQTSRNKDSSLHFGSSLKKEIDKFINLRSHLEDLEDDHIKQQLQVIAVKEELISSKQRIDLLEKDLNKNEENIKQAKSTNNIAQLGLLLSQHKRIKMDIEAEKSLYSEISKDLEDSELGLLRTDLSHQQILNLSDQVREKEEAILYQKEKMAEIRIEKRKEIEKLSENKWKKAEREMMRKEEMQRATQQKLLDDAVISRQRARDFIQKAAFERKNKKNEEKEKTEEAELKQLNESRKLKNKIKENRENIRAFQAKNQRIQNRKIQKEKEEADRIFRETGRNSKMVMMERRMLKKKQLEERQFKMKQEENKAKLIEKLLAEEYNYERRKKLYPYLFADKRQEPLKKKKVINYSGKFLNDVKQNEEDLAVSSIEVPSPTLNEISIRVRKTSSSSDEIDDCESVPNLNLSDPHSICNHDNDEVIVRPDFEGIWDEKHKPYKVITSEGIESKPIGGSLVEKRILKAGLEKQRQNITKRQLAAGREFKGKPFTSKPSLIHFKNLEIGETYQMKVLITNVSYTINFCKLIGVSENLKDFFKISFKPTGQMSAGMACDMHVTFKPMINKDLEGEVLFQAQTGTFSIPVKCSTKKCELSIDQTNIQFGKQVVGECVSKTLTLYNKGALSTKFQFFKVVDEVESKEKSENISNKISEELANDEDRTKEQVPNKDPLNDDVVTYEQASIYEEQSSSASSDENIKTNSSKRNSSKSSDNFQTFSEMSTGKTTEGLIQPYSSIHLAVVFSPSIPGDINDLFRITFDDKDSNYIDINVFAKAVDVPVWLERKEIDLKICMYDRLYQDQIVVSNRANYALKLTFEVPDQLKDHLELLPKTGYIQARSQFTVQLKFLPRLHLAKDAKDMFDLQTGILEAPMIIKVADQARPVSFTVNAVITSSDLQFDQQHLEFGFCSIFEAVTSSIQLTNKSILPQRYGFMNLPEFVDVQPNNGFGTILPLETITIDVIMKAQKAREYNFTLVCKTSINRQFVVQCHSIGVHPPLSISHQVINFAATALDDVTSEVFDVINSHTDANEFMHAVPRVGKGPIAPVGPTSFEFVIPEDAPFKIFPLVGTVNPGEKCQVAVEFSPKLNEQEVREEAVMLMRAKRAEKKKRIEEQKRINEQEMIREEEQLGKSGKKSPKIGQKIIKASHDFRHKAILQTDLDEEEDTVLNASSIDLSSSYYKNAILSLIQRFPGSFTSYSVPCFLASRKCSSEVGEELNYNPANTIYIEVGCPIVRPSIIIISNDGDRVIKFGEISIGLSSIQTITILNISEEDVKLSSSLLSSSGAFTIVNSWRKIKPGETHSCKISFAPLRGQLYQEDLIIRSGESSIYLSLRGAGVTPVLELDPNDHCTNFGHVIVGDKTTKIFKLTNTSTLGVEFNLKLDSMNPERQLPQFRNQENIKEKHEAGTQNYNGSAVFDCFPCAGCIPPGKSSEISVIFHPDHASGCFRDLLHVVLFDSKLAHTIQLKGQAFNHVMFVEDDDDLQADVESLLPKISLENLQDTQTRFTKPILLTFVSYLNDVEASASQRVLKVGCIKSLKFANRKGVDCVVENFQHAQQKGFLIDMMKCTVEAGNIKPFTISWTPKLEVEKQFPVTSSFVLTVKGDVIMTYDVTLSGVVVFT